MSAIFHSVRDLHTNYLLPAPFAGKVAFLPFLVEEYHAADGSHYVVSRVVQGFSAPGFGPGVELTSWSGMTVDRAVELNADRFAGSNDAARHARGVESLTVRSLRIHLPPVEEWVVVGYRGTDGVDRELRQDWLVADNLPPFADVDALSPAAANSGVDIGGDEIGRAKTLLFAPRGRRVRTCRRQQSSSSPGPARTCRPTCRRCSGPGRVTPPPAPSVTCGSSRSRCRTPTPSSPSSSGWWTNCRTTG